MAAKQKIFQAKQFTATEFYTAEQKAEFGNRLAAFLLGGCKAGDFTKILYDRLNSTFGHIAHFNIRGFYDVWFSTPAKRVAFIQHTLDHTPNGLPKFTFVDMEREFQTWLKKSGLLERYRADAETDQHYDSVFNVARSLIQVAKKPTPEAVAAKVALARGEVEGELGGKNLNDARVQAITDALVREFCTNSIEYKLASISENVNAFGHNGFLFVARNGEVWQCSGYRGPGGIHLKQGDVLTVPLRRGAPDWGSLGFEVPEQKRNAPHEVVQELWGE